MSGLKRIGTNAPTILITLIIQRIIGKNKPITIHSHGSTSIHAGTGSQIVKGQVSTSILSNRFSLLVNTEKKSPTKLGVGAALTFAGYVAYKTIKRKTHEKGGDTPKP